MGDKITIDELKMFLGTGLSGFVDDDVCLLSSLTEMGHIVVSRYDFDLDFRAENFRPCVRPWSHLTREIEHNGESIVPIEFFTSQKLHPDEIAPVIEALKKQVVLGKASYDKTMLYASMLFDIFNWLNRTGDDGQPLAVEMEG